MRYLLCIFFLAAKLSILAQDVKKSLLYDFVIERQQHEANFSIADIFDTDNAKDISGNKNLTHYTELTLKKVALTEIFSKKPTLIRMSVPVRADKIFSLVLAAVPINSTGDFSFGTIANNINSKTSVDQGLHYRGYIAGDSTSFTCISVFQNGEVMGVFANSEGNFIIGKMKNNTGYVVYNSSEMLIHPSYECAAGELPSPLSKPSDNGNEITKINQVPTVLCKKVRFYWEGDYHLYSENFNGDLTAVQNYLTGIFNVVASIYQNEGIIVELTKTYVWTSADPFSNASSNQGLNTFKARWNSRSDNYGGDLAHLIAGGKTNNGGVAYILNFDQCNRAYTYGYSNVWGTFESYPDYAWDAQVLTHEIGHNLGSNHTHWCGWNTGSENTCGAIDNCASAESGSGCTTCSATNDINASPANFKGTIMSYCYLKNGIGVSFVNGFGPLPQAVIRNNVSAAVCLTSSNVWTGAVNTAWENTGNWSCGILPDAKTDVVVNAGLSRYPIINSNVSCRSVKEATGTSIKINSNFHLIITGK